ncbi:class I SAM-dependent methyltransferase [Sulfurimonas sp. CS5]|uniref:class I SAM-dependent methyltransferase n=1 Tax=Sulfurimonas sp. CS5 TaxID=3391145 RepID=UPI0039EA7A52
MNNTNKWNADKYNKHADFVSNLAFPVIELLNPQENEKILDLGCGDGTLAVEIEKFNSKVTAVDLSESMIMKAKEKGIQASIMSATELTFENEFDAVFSNAVLHWVKEADTSIKKISISLKKNGRLIAEFGGYGNIKFLTEAMQEIFNKHKEFGKFNNPWSFPKDSEYKKLLENNNFNVEYIELIPRPTKIDDISNWLDIFANGIIANLTQEQQKQFKDEVREVLKPKIYSEKDGWTADYVRLRLKALKIV